MKKILYFIVGLIYLPFMALVSAVEYVTDLGDTLIDNIKFIVRMRKQMKEAK